MDHRILYNAKISEKADLPVMPLIVGMEGIVGEACSIKGVAAIVIGDHYYDSPDESMDWNLRVETARKECMKALGRGIEAVVYDSRHGIIPDNFATEDDDEDYEIDEDEPFKVRVDNDKVFLISLAGIGSIRLMEREDSFFFNPNPDKNWNEDSIKQYSGGSYIDISNAYNLDELIIKFGNF